MEAHGERVLLAEDDLAQREILQELLELEGYQVTTAAEPAEVLVQLQSRPDVVIMDLGGIANADVLQSLKDVSPRPALFVISGDQALPAMAAAFGADGYMGKPYEVDRLLVRLRQVLDGRAERSARAGWVGKWEGEGATPA